MVNILMQIKQQKTTNNGLSNERSFPEDLLRKSFDSAFSLLIAEDDDEESSEEMSRFLSTGITLKK